MKKILPILCFVLLSSAISGQVSTSSNDDLIGLADNAEVFGLIPKTNSNLKVLKHFKVKSDVKKIAKVAQASVIKSVTISAGGLLNSLIASELNSITNLTIAGNIDARDFRILRDSLPLLEILDLSTVNVQSYTGSEGTISLNTTYPQKMIPNYAFFDSITYNGKSSLTTITLPTTITSIGKSAFNGCYGLTGTINLPSLLTDIGDEAFAGCDITGTLNIPSLVTNIGSLAFSYCSSLTAVNIPMSVITIGEWAFDACSGIISVDANNQNYSSLDGVLYDKQKTRLIQCPTSKTGSYTIPSNVKIIGEWAFESCGLTSVVIPESVTLLLRGAFSSCTSLTSINIPLSITSLPAYTFQNCSSLTGITIPNSVTSIGSSAFYVCSKLINVSIPSSVKIIGARAFGYCTALTEIIVQDGNANYVSSEGVLFNKKQNKLIQCPSGKQGNYIIPNTVDSLDNYSFHRCSALTSITIPNSVTSIGNYCFLNIKGLTSITIPFSVSYIGDNAFESCSALTSIYVNNSIPLALSTYNVFLNVNKTACTLYVPFGTKTLYAGAPQWSDFTNIVELAPVSKTINLSIAGSLSSSLSSELLNTISKLTITGTIDARDFVTMRDLMPLLTELDLSGTNIVAYAGNLGTSNSITNYSANEIPFTAFYNEGIGSKERLTKIVLPLSTTSIAESAFDGCIGLTGDFIIPSQVTHIGNYAFYYCINLASITIPNSVTTIDDYAFYYCNGLTSITIPSAVTSIGNAAFRNCNNLTAITVQPANLNYSSLDGVLFDKNQTILIQYPIMKQGNYVIPNSVGSIADYAFYYCNGLTGVTIPNAVTSIGISAFYRCTNVTNLTIPSAVATIGSRAFGYCTKLTAITVLAANPNYSSVDGVLFNKNQSTLIQFPNAKSTTYIIPNTVTTVGDYAFYNCTSLTSVTIPTSVLSFGNYAFSSCKGLTSITIPNSVTSIGNYALNSCSGLTNITIPNSVSTIGAYAFGYCNGLTSINVDRRPLVLTATDVFNGVNTTSCVLNVPYSSKSLYSAADQWSNFTNIIENSNGFLLGNDIVNLTASAGNVNVSINANVAWTSSSNQTWLTVNPSSGTGNNTLVLAAQANQTTSPRTAIVTVSASGFTSQTITILQSGLPKTISVTAGNLSKILTTDELNGINDLTLMGTIDARDFKTMRDLMPMLVKLNLSGVNIAAYTGTEGTYSTALTDYPANTTPRLGLYNKNSLTSVILPNTLTAIGRSTFNSSRGLTSLIIPSTVNSIGYAAFNFCTSLSSVNIPSLVTYLDTYTFGNCTSLKSIVIPSSITSIGNSAFSYSGLENIVLPTGLQSISAYAFQNCSALKTVSIPSTVSTIRFTAFSYNNALTKFEVSADNNKFSALDGVLFDKTQKKLISYPSAKNSVYQIPIGVNVVDTGAFEGSTVIQSITIPSSVTTISPIGFSYCINLKTIDIPASVTSIGEYSFYNCNSLTSIKVNANPVNLSASDSVFNFVNKNTCVLYVPSGTKALYKAAYQWQDFTNIVEFATAVQNVSDAVSIQIYPNPVTDGFRINGLEGSTKLSVIDLNGRIMIQKQVFGNDFVNVSSLTNGMYIVKLITEKGTSEQIIVKK